MNEAPGVMNWIGSLYVGEPRFAGELAVAPVYTRAAVSEVARYRTLQQALEAGELIVSEKPQPSVPRLLAVNSGDLPVLILDGEEVVGGQQNRVANTTVLVPAHAVFELEVSCVERGRWFERASAFAPGEAVYPSLRGEKARQVSAAMSAGYGAVADQLAVWSEIAARQLRMRTASETDALNDLYRYRQEALNEVEGQLIAPSDSAVGVVALISSRAQCADIFDTPSTLHHYWSRLVRSYALEALDYPTSTTVSADRAQHLLDRAAQATMHAFPSRGVGTDVRLTGHGISGRPPWSTTPPSSTWPSSVKPTPTRAPQSRPRPAAAPACERGR